MGTRSSTPDSEAVCGVMVTYNGGAIVETVAGALLGQIGHLVIVDNHSEEETLRSLRALQRRRGSRLTLVFNPVNRGLAAALNQGVTRAMEAGYPFVLTMDQDSHVAPDMVRQMLAAYQRGSATPIGIVAPQTRVVFDGT